jgi:hypothetical protein
MPHSFSPAGNGDVLDIVALQNIKGSDDIVSHIFDSYHLPIIFHILDDVKIINLSEPIEKFKYWDWFQCLASELILPRIEINSGVEADKVACNFRASIASAYMMANSKVTFLDINNKIPGLDRLLKYKGKLRKLWLEIRNPACKTAVNWIMKSIRRMTQGKALERCEIKIGNTEVIRQTIWPIVKSLLRRGRLRAQTAIHGPLGRKFHSKQLLNAWRISSHTMICVM